MKLFCWSAFEIFGRKGTVILEWSVDYRKAKMLPKLELSRYYSIFQILELKIFQENRCFGYYWPAEVFGVL